MNTSQILNYSWNRIETSIYLEIPNGTIINENTIISKVTIEGSFVYTEYTVYSIPIAWDNNGTWELIDLNMSNYETNSWDIPFLDLYLDNDGELDHKGLKIKVKEIYTDNGDSYKPRFNKANIRQDYNKIIYEDIVPGLIDYEFVLLRTGFQLNTVIKERPNLRWNGRTDENLYVEYELKGDLARIDDIKERFPTDFIAIDSEGREYPIKKEIRTVGNKQKIIETIPLGWLMSEARYPVILDPITELTPTDDIHLDNDADEEQGCFMIKFDTSDLYSQNVTDANLTLHVNAFDTAYNDTWFDFDIEWDESSNISDLDTAGGVSRGDLGTVEINADGFFKVDVTGSETIGIKGALAQNRTNITLATNAGINCLFFDPASETVINGQSLVRENSGKIEYQIYSSEIILFTPPTLSITTVDLRPNITLITPENKSVMNIDTSLFFNFTSSDPTDTIDNYLFASNDSSNLDESLLYKSEGDASGDYSIFNVTRLPINPLNSGLVSLYHFDNRSDFGDSQTESFDYSNNDNNLTRVGTTTNTYNNTDAIFGYSTSFDGNDYWKTSSTPTEIPSGAEGENLTISAWVYWAGTSGDDDLITGLNGEWLFSVETDGKLWFYLFGGNNAGGTTSINTNEWTHVAVVWDTEDDTITTYINGDVDKIASHTDTSADTGVNLFVGGRDSTGNDVANTWFFDGLIDDLGIWSKSLSASEIKDLYRIQEGRYFWKGQATDRKVPTDSEVREFRVYNNSYTPSFTLHGPANDTKYNTFNITINVSINDDDADSVKVVDVLLFGSNSTNTANIEDYVLYKKYDVNNTQLNFTYNFTALPTNPNSEGLVALWHFDERGNLGETEGIGSLGLVYDFAGSGGRHNATGITANKTSYKFGQAVQGDGTNVEVDYASTLEVINNNANFSLFAWIRPENLGGNKYIFSQTRLSCGTGFGQTWMALDGTDLLSTGLNASDVAGQPSIELSAVAVSAGVWHLVGITYNGSDFTGWQDGEEQLTVPVGNIDQGCTSDYKIGRIHTGSNKFDGQIDEVSVWNRTLTSTEILNMYQAPDDDYFWEVNASNRVYDTYIDSNVSEMREFSLDRVYPNGTLIFPPDNHINNTANQNFTGTFFDNRGLLQVTLRVYQGAVDFITDVIAIADEALSATIGSIQTLTDGIYTWWYEVTDTHGNVNQTGNFTLTIDTINPKINITFPQNISYNQDITDLNYTLNETNPDSCWYSLDLGLTNTSFASCGTNATGLISSEGSNTWTVYMNDSAGNTNQTNVTFFKDTIFPNINMTYPQNISYNENVSDLNYTVSDANLDSCWYSLDLGLTNNTLICGNNATGLTSNEGSNTWIIYANDSLNNINQSNATFFKDSINPQINITYPLNISYNTNISTLNYTVSDTNLDSCWYSLDSGLNNITISACGDNLTGLTSTEGGNTWTVYTNDTLNNVNSSNVTFFKDTVIPNITFVFPTREDGEYTQDFMKINVTVNDTNLDTIIIRLYKSSGIISEQSSNSSFFYVYIDGLEPDEYFINATGNDSVGNTINTENRRIVLLKEEGKDGTDAGGGGGGTTTTPDPVTEILELITNLTEEIIPPFPIDEVKGKIEGETRLQLIGLWIIFASISTLVVFSLLFTYVKKKKKKALNQYNG